MFATLVNSFRVPEIRKKLAFTAAMLALYRLGAVHPGAGHQHRRARRRSPEATFARQRTILGFLNLFSGG